MLSTSLQFRICADDSRRLYFHEVILVQKLGLTSLLPDQIFNSVDGASVHQQPGHGHKCGIVTNTHLWHDEY